MQLHVANIVGARPDCLKMAALLTAYHQHPDWFAPTLIHTGPPAAAGMSRLFFDQLGLPAPAAYLGVGGGSPAEQTAHLLVPLEQQFRQHRPDLVVVVGAGNSTLAAALVAAQLGLPLAHVDAGLRSFDRTVPEEINRVVTDVLSDYCFITSEEARANLLREGVAPEKIQLVGNVMIDTLLRLKQASQQSPIRRDLNVLGSYGFVTLHRPGNVDQKSVLMQILAALDTIQKELPLVFAVHPRTRHRLEEFGFWPEIQTWPQLKLTEPLGYLDALCLLANARVVLTDSGGVQEETTVLGVPCLTIRPNTERPVTVTEGTNTLVGPDHHRLVEETRKVLRGQGKQGRIPKYWDGQAAERIVQHLHDHPPVLATA